MSFHSQVQEEDVIRADTQHLGEMFHKLAAPKENRIEEARLQPDHLHMLISIPPKYTVSQVVGIIKGKSAVRTLALAVAIELGPRRRLRACSIA